MNQRKTLELLQRYESRNITYIARDGGWPIVWERANGSYIWDSAGRKYLDLTAAFGVAAAGHANPRVVRAGQRQMERLLHAMGDVHPHALKAQLAQELSRLTFERWNQRNGSHGKTVFCNSGFESVEVALKTAMQATGKPGVIVFEGGYHGLGYGTLNVTERNHFRAPFLSQLREFGHFVPFPAFEDDAFESNARRSRTAKLRQQTLQSVSLDKIESMIRAAIRKRSIGAILVEPIQVRGGIRIPPRSFLPLLRELCNDTGTLLIVDEIYTGFGRTGKWFACEHSNIAPDIVCVGKALTGGFPLSACVARSEIMDAAWPSSSGEAIHTSTFLGHPVGCAMALAQIKEIQQQRLVEKCKELGPYLLSLLRKLELKSQSFRVRARGVGLLAGIEICQRDGQPATTLALRLTQQMLNKGYIVLPEGEHSNVIGFTPPLIINKRQLTAAISALEELILQEDLLTNARVI